LIVRLRVKSSVGTAGEATPDAALLARTTAAKATARPVGTHEKTGDSGPPGNVDPRLLIWLSPSFPVGAFAYSHGLELAADRGWVRNRDGLTAWLADLVAIGSLRNDLILLASAWRAAISSDLAALKDANDLALALQPSAERRLEAVTQGNAFLSTLLAAWPADTLQAVANVLSADSAYPVAVGAGTAAHDVGLEGTLHAFGIALVGNLMSAAIRLSIVGQTDGQRVIASLVPAIAVAATAAVNATLDDLGSATLRSDLASLAHETQYSRLFRS
jgi:urease accessory protein